MAKKTLCEWSKDDIRKRPDKLKKIVEKPAYYCKSCARVASEEAHLCKPEPLK